jgi:hypothetical protein
LSWERKFGGEKEEKNVSLVCHPYGIEREKRNSSRGNIINVNNLVVK